MSILTLRPGELIKFRKMLSDVKNDTNELNFDTVNHNSNAAAYNKVRDKKDDAYIAKLELSDNDSDMLAELELLERDHTNG